MKAFIFDPLWKELITNELLADLEAAGVEPIVTQQPEPLSNCKALYSGTEPRILAINPDYVGWKLSANDYASIPDLRAILGAATSYSWIDRSIADERKIPICNIRNFSTQAVAEWAITMMLCLARQVPCLIKEQFPLDFDKDFMKFRGIELRGRTAGIVGLGDIGSAIAERCAGLGMKVVYWSKSPKVSSHQAADLQTLFQTADVIFPALANNETTRKIITTELVRSIKSSAILVSVVHELFDEALVLEMVREGKLFGFGFEAKPASFNQYLGNVWAAPAYGWATDGSMNNSMRKWIENIVNASRGLFPNRVN